jgi:hypothetical protein
VKDAGYGLDAIRGYEETHTAVYPPHPIAAAAGRCVEPRVRRGVGISLVLILLYAAYTGAVAGVVLALAGIVLCYAAGAVRTGPREVTTTVHRAGMDAEEVLSRLVQHDEHERMKNEDAEAQARKARRQEDL